jgi:hypothetical protein
MVVFMFHGFGSGKIIDVTIYGVNLSDDCVSVIVMTQVET